MKHSVYTSDTSTRSQTIHLLTLLALSLLTMQLHFEASCGTAAHAIAHLDLPHATLYFTSIQTSFTLLTTSISTYRESRTVSIRGFLGIDIKTSSLIVARRTRAAVSASMHHASSKHATCMQSAHLENPDLHDNFTHPFDSHLPTPARSSLLATDLHPTTKHP